MLSHDTIPLIPVAPWLLVCRSAWPAGKGHPLTNPAMRTSRSILLLGALGVLSACEQPTHPTLHNPRVSLDLQALAPPLAPQRIRWRARLDGDYSRHSPGVASDGTVYVSLPNGKLQAIAPDGSIRWTFQAGLGGAVWGPVSVAGDGTIYVAGLVPAGSVTTGAVFAISPAGTRKWVFTNTGQIIIAGPNVGPDGNIYAATQTGGIGLFSLTPQGQRRFATSGFVERSPIGKEIAFGSNQLYVTFNMGGTGTPPGFFGFTLSGSQLFRNADPMTYARVAVGPNGNPVVQMFPANIGLSLTSFQPHGSRQWSFYQFPGNTQGNPDVGPDNSVYSVRNLSTLLALGVGGSELWRYVDAAILFEPRVRQANDFLFMGGRVSFGQSGFFQAVSTAGVPLWRISLPDEPAFAPYGQLVPMTRPVFSPDGNTAYVVTDVTGDGANPTPYSYLYAIDLSAGLPTNTPPQVVLTATSPTVIAPGGSVSFVGQFTDPDVGDGPWGIRWTFGNGAITGVATAPGSASATRTYPTAGTYNVRFRVTDARGAVSASAPVTITVR